MPKIDVKYLKTDPRNGNLIYRRKVPKALASLYPQGEIVRSLGRQDQGGLAAYSRVHAEIEHQLTLAKHGSDGLTPVQRRDALAATLKGWGADPRSPGKTPEEREWREIAADALILPYQDPHTGDYEGVPATVHAEAVALLKGVDGQPPPPTVGDAFRAYLKEKQKSIPDHRRKQEQRFRRAEVRLIAALGGDKPLSGLTRADARAWRDQRIAEGVSPATICRERNDIAAVISFGMSELEHAAGTNPFSGLKLPQVASGRQQDREPLPEKVVAGVYADLANDPDLLAIWTLLDFTGARPSEIRQLRLAEFVVAHPIPHIVIRAHEDRTLKTTWSAREVPLVGDALSSAQGVLERRRAGEWAFPRYATPGGMDRLSAALGRRIRKHTTNPKHVAYSLRHNMKDRMREAQVFPQVQFAIEGHALGVGPEAAYGMGLTLAAKRDGLLKALAGYRGTEAPAATT